MLPEGLLCIGGCDSERCYDDVFLLTLKTEKFKYLQIGLLYRFL